jgi:hypothetical protein
MLQIIRRNRKLFDMKRQNINYLTTIYLLMTIYAGTIRSNCCPLVGDKTLETVAQVRRQQFPWSSPLPGDNSLTVSREVMP